jgi:phospholipase C
MLSLRFAALVFLGLAPLAAVGQTIPIEHFIYIIQENHSFDNYFGTYPGANGIPAGTALPDYPGGPKMFKPFHNTATHVPHDLPHYWLAAKVAYDEGAMDGFLWAEYRTGNSYYGRGIPIPTPNPNLVKIGKKHDKSQAKKAPATEEVVSPDGFTDDEDYDAPEVGEENEASVPQPLTQGSPNPKKRPAWVNYTLSYMDYTNIPNYWEYARKYTLCDAFFSSLTGPSQPNHLYAVAAQSGDLVDNIGEGTDEIYSFPSIIELLGNANISWTYYTGHSKSLENIWNPLPGFQKYASGFDVKAHLAYTGQFYDDIKNGTLPQVCWLIPNKAESEHPPKNVRDGMRYVTKLVNAVMQSSYWQNCAIIIMWDDYGGFYDHVVPAQVDEFGYGFRVPALVISPYSLAGQVVSTTYDLTSPLKLLETKFGLPPLTSRDSGSHNMLECFNFSQKPLPPDIIIESTKLDFSDMEAAAQKSGAQ